MTDSNVKEVPAHPLLQGTRTTISTWQEWRKAWDEASSLEARLGLLHVGFNPELSNFTERFCFYLDVANGYASLFHASLGGGQVDNAGFQPGTFGYGKSAGEVLRILANKAFSEVSKHCFGLKEEYPKSTFAGAGWLASSVIVDKLIWFIQQPGIRGSTTNLDGRSHAGAVMRKFLLEMIYFAFEDRRNGTYKYDGYYPAISELLYPRRAELISVLNAIGDVRWLLKPNVIGHLDDACIAALTKLALNTTSQFPGERELRSPASIAEACYLGLPSAHVLVVHGTWAKEKERLEIRADLIRQREEVERQLTKT